MKKITRTLFASILLASVFVIPALAENPNPIEQGFVCPVLGGKAGMNGMHKGISHIDNTIYGVDSFYTVVGPEVSVPQQATNGGNGINNPHGPYDSPGDTSYTAIWP